MRHLFDTRKEHKSIKLVKKLQEEADKEWENEITRRREQELNDEAIAKELQAQLEQESSSSTNNSSNHTNSSPPPLPTKPRAYNSSIHLSSHTDAAASSSTASPTNYSTQSLPTTTSTLPTSPTTSPLYSISSFNNTRHSQPALPPRDRITTTTSNNNNTNNKKPVKSYLPTNSNERYKPELQFALASPAPCPSSVFYQKTPKMTPAITPLKALDTSATTNQSSASFYNGNKTPTSSRPAPVTVQPPPASTQSPTINRMEMPMPADVNPTHFQSISNHSAPSSFNNHHQPSVTSPAQNAPYQPPSYAPHHSDPIVLPLSEPVASQQQQPYPPALIPVAPLNPPLYPQQHDANASYFPPPPPPQQQQHYPHPPVRQTTSSPAISLPLNTNGIYQQATTHAQPQQQSPSTLPSSYSFNSVYQATPPPPPQQQQQQQQSYASVKPPLVSTCSSSSSSSGFQLPPMPVFASSSSSSNHVTAKPQPQVQQQAKTLAPTNPYYKKQDGPLLSTSTISLKPDEGQAQQQVHHQDLLGFDDEEDDDDDWDIVRPAKKTLDRPPTPMAMNHKEEEEEDEDDKESAVDYSDMVYHSGEKVQEEEEKEKKQGHSEHHEEEEDGEEEDWEDTAIDPFDDDFAVHVPKGSTATSATVVGDFRKKRTSSVVTTLAPTIQILDPTIIPTTATASPVTSDEQEGEEKIIAHKRKPMLDKQDNKPRQYEEKESQEIEHRPITPHMHRPSMGSSSFAAAAAAATPASSFYSPSPAPPSHPSQQQHAYYYQRPQSTPLIEMDLPEDELSKVYPTNILKAGAPAGASASASSQMQQQTAANPYFKKQGIVPATDYGYFKEDDQLANKLLPKLPPSATSNDDRHITVSSINPGQRVWIRIHPTDTGKDLAERIHIVASYQTRRVTKITTKQGRQISLDNKPLFEDWNEIINFKEGEQWTVEWVPIEHPYVDIITEGKEFMKQLKANFRGSSSK